MKKQFNQNSIEHLYLHVPFCKHLCNYCDFYKHIVSPDKISEFEEYLTKTSIVHTDFFDKYNQSFSPLKSLYFGGGTPSLWDGANFLSQRLKESNILFDDNCEITLELDPGSWKEDSFKRWLDFGVNRVSIGSQAMDQRFIELMDRSHDLKETLKTIEFVRNNVSNFSVDFMLGLPQSESMKRDIITELKMLLEYEPTHISLYILKARKNYIHLQNIPHDSYVAEEYLKVCDFLEENGLKQYEVSNFSKPGFESVHNLAYWKYKSVAALGPSSTGLFLIDDKACRYKWKPKSFDYVLEKLNDKEVLLETIYLGLRCSLGIDANIVGNESHKLEKLFCNWKERSIGEISNSKFVLNSRGYIIMDSLMDEIFGVIDCV
jgi:oxygen-independent coproporphyrinogen-3 oxidase